MTKVSATDGIGASGHVRLETYDVDQVASERPDWRDLEKEEQLALLTDGPLGVNPTNVGETENLLLDTFFEELGRGQLDLPYLAVGESAVSPSTDNDELNSEVWRTAVGRDEGDGATRITSTLLSDNEANGENIVEIGFANDNDLLTHTILSPTDRVQPKTAELAVVIYYEIRYHRVE